MQTHVGRSPGSPAHHGRPACIACRTLAYRHPLRLCICAVTNEFDWLDIKFFIRTNAGNKTVLRTSTQKRLLTCLLFRRPCGGCASSGEGSLTRWAPDEKAIPLQQIGAPASQGSVCRRWRHPLPRPCSARIAAYARVVRTCRKGGPDNIINDRPLAAAVTRACREAKTFFQDTCFCIPS